MNYDFSEEEVLEVDIHDMEVWQAWTFLERLMYTIPSEIQEIIVIHGYRSGTNLLNMVRFEFNHRRVHRKFLSLNPGRTSLILN